MGKATRNEILSAEELHKVRLQQLGNVFAKADSALAGRRVTVTVKASEYDTDAPAWTADGRDVTLVECPGQNMTSAKGLVVANGLNYHELCHVMYTPSGGTAMYREIESRGLHNAYNMLEDQRIESILVTRFPSTRPYLVATCAEYFLTRATEEAKAQAWPVLSGRKYLPKNMRHQARSLFVSNTPAFPKLANQIDAVVDEYRKIRFGVVNSKADVAAAVDLVVEFHKLVSQVVPPAQAPNPFSHGVNVAQGAPGNGGTDQKDASTNDVANGADKTGDDGAPGDGGANQGDTDGQGGKAEGEGGSEAGGNGAGEGSGKQSNTPLDAALESTLNSVMNDASVRSEITSQTKVLNTKGNDFDGILPTGNVTQKDVTPLVASQARTFGRHLQRLVTDQDPGFDKFRDSGRLNIGRAVRGESLDTLFDQWSEGKQDAESIEVVILLDTSSSMLSQMTGACEAAWAIKYGVDSLPSHAARCSVITFSDVSSYLYRPNDRATGNRMRARGASGGTSAHPAVSEAARIFAISERRKKILISVSDGSWADSYRAVPVIERLNKAGVITAAFWLTSGYVEKIVAEDSERSKQLMEGMRNKHQLLVRGSEVGAITALGKMLVKRAIKG